MAKENVSTHCGKCYHEGTLGAFGGGGQPNLQRQKSFLGRG